ncbi:MAG: TIR domain-containing protein [Mesorhizobium sp.]|uniref:TIR domain-containing protein n=1 Tax=Mesorhizobium sp. TaxID=1871066 RepID=UPI000FE6AAC9|nr:TIR domain-containing protein [Mesorhizobium sp.]RWI48090.1 MAG: TIR domain-containing protein [Mesorhizobium sp.]
MAVEFRDGSGRKVSIDKFFDNIRDKAVELAMTHLEKRARDAASALIDPETGKHSVVFVRTKGEAQLVMSTKGSPVYARELERRLGVERGMVRSMMDKPKVETPIVYLAHGSPDHKTLARPLAERLMQNGIEVWLDAWEIGSGDSVRQKMDQGLGNCTHFVVLLTPTSIGRPWVETEIDVGFVRAVEGHSKFIGLRIGVGVSQLSPFLQSRRCPELDLSDTAAVDELIAELHGISRKPPRGSSPRYVKAVPAGLQFWAPGAIAVAEYLVRKSKQGTKFDPQIHVSQVAEALGFPEGDVRLAILDLSEAGLVEESATIDSEAFWPTPGLFVEFDRHFLDFDNEQDAIAVANWVISNGARSIKIDDLSKNFPDWLPRRMNSALSFLEEGALIQAQHILDQKPWAMHSLTVTDRTRRFVRDHG